MKLKQIKEINSQTIDQELAAKMCRILGVWNSYTSDRVKRQGFIVEDQWYGTIPGDTSCSSHSSLWQDPAYSDGKFVRTPHGIKIIPNVSTSHEMRVLHNGHAWCWLVYNDSSDYIRYSEDKRTGNKMPETIRSENAYNAIKWVELLINEGFFITE